MAKDGPVIAFFGWQTPQSLEECKTWIHSNGWTNDDVRIKKTESSAGYLVLAKRQLFDIG